MVSLRISGYTVHNVKFWVLIGERDSRDHISSKINAKNEHSGKWKRNLAHDEEDKWKNLWNV